MNELAQKAADHAVLFLIGQLIIFVLTLVGSLAIGKRFIDKEYPGFVQRVETGMSTLKSELLSEIDALRRDIIDLSRQFVDHKLESARQARDVTYLDRRITKVEDKLDKNEDTQSFRRRKTDAER